MLKSNWTALLTIVVSLLANSSAAAEWIKVGENRNDTVYVDADTINKSGNLVKMWSLFDFKTRLTASFGMSWSFKSQDEYDCSEETFRTISITYYSENMGKGKVVATKTFTEEWDPEFDPIAPGSVIQAMMKIACKKK